MYAAAGKIMSVFILAVSWAYSHNRMCGLM